LDSLQHPGVCQSQPSPLSHVAEPANSLYPSWMLKSRCDKRTIAPVSLIRHARAKTLTHPLTVGTLSKLTCSCAHAHTFTHPCPHTPDTLSENVFWPYAVIRLQAFASDILTLVDRSVADSLVTST
jgi:hypothetical protein